jgi:hypothetical protein
MTTPGYPPPPPPRRMSPGLRLLLIIGIPVLVVLLLVAFGISLFNAFRTDPVSQNATADAGTSVSIDIPNATLFLSPSDDDEVHVAMRGSYSGSKPRLDVRTDRNETEITGGCPRGWFVLNRCSVRIDVELPAELDVELTGQNGRITATDLEGDLDLSTTNGAISIDASSGTVTAGTTNGRIELTDTTSANVDVTATNGSVRLEFTAAPDTVSARSTNGEVTVRVPDDGESYRVDADTTNGDVDTADVRTDPDSDRSISVRTTNGRVAIEQAR